MDLQTAIKSILPNDTRPVVVYSELFSISRKLKSPVKQQPKEVIDTLLEILGPNRTLIMPTYTDGFKGGYLNLDSEPSQTGIISEVFRRLPNVLRSKSVFFSFSAMGPEAKEFTSLDFIHTYGPGSSYAWIEEHDAHLLSIGVSWEACSLKHRSEWHERVPYRYDKTFQGEITYRGQQKHHTETLFVRSLDPCAENNWRNIDEILSRGGMKKLAFGGGQIASITCSHLMREMRSVLRADPYYFVDDAANLRKHFSR